MRGMLLAILLLAGGGAAAHAQANTPKPAYDFSLPRDERIKLAESAAPPEISGKATVYLLEPAGYVKAREGTNGFSCFVDRQNLLNLEPTCFDAEGSSSTLPTRLFVEELRAKGNQRGDPRRLQNRKIPRAAKTRHCLYDVHLRLPLHRAEQSTGSHPSAPDVLRPLRHR
jgi:hypothetical protein